MSFEPIHLLWLLLPLAAASGWWAARRDAQRKTKEKSPFPTGYYRGVNYLLNEQPDKAIELFTRMLEVNTETVETHLALGSLFRRRGEVERAIRIHQNLMARPALAQEYRTLALYELAQDYFKAGLLDRAEGLFLELCESREHAEASLRSLLQIYEQEKDWSRAISIAQRLLHYANEPTRVLLAQYHCELAEQQLHSGLQRDADDTLARAMQYDPRCVRVRLLNGRLFQARGAMQKAINEWQSIEHQNPVFMEEIVEELADTFHRINDDAGLEQYLSGLFSRHPGERTLLVLADVMSRRGASQEASQLVRNYLRDHASTALLAWLMSQPVSSGRPALVQDEVISTALERMSDTRRVYQCERCGYRGTTLHWQCPACQSWSLTRPVSGRGEAQNKLSGPDATAVKKKASSWLGT